MVGLRSFKEKKIRIIIYLFLLKKAKILCCLEKVGKRVPLEIVLIL